MAANLKDPLRGPLGLTPCPLDSQSKIFTEHKVQSGETLRSLAVKFNTTTATLAQINHITSNAFIFPGMVLKVPDSGLQLSSMTVDRSIMLNELPDATNADANGISKNRQLAEAAPRQSLSDILGLSFETSKLTVNSISSTNTKNSTKPDRNDAQKKSRHTNEELIHENAGFIKLKCILLPQSVEGTLIVTSSALMFDPVDQNLGNLSSITSVEDISWIECVRVPKTTSTTLKLEEEFPMVNSILRSFSDYFEESSDKSFHFLLMTLSIDFNRAINFQYYKLVQSDVTQLFNILSDLSSFKFEIAPSIEKDKSYVDFQKSVRASYPGIQPNWFILNDRTHKILDHEYRLQVIGRRSLTSVEVELTPPDQQSIERSTAGNTFKTFEGRPETASISQDYIKVPKPRADGAGCGSYSSEASIYIPELQNCSEGFILGDSEQDNSVLKQLTTWLPDESAGISGWRQIFSSEKQGHSLNTLYRNCSKEKYPKSNNILLIESTNGLVFGSYLTELPRKIETHMSKKFYGSGESFLFSFYYKDRRKNQNSQKHKKCEKYSWQSVNNFIATGDNDHFAVGGGKGAHGLWIDSRLCGGSSLPCDTFGNCESLAGERDFIISSLEVWVLE